MRRSRLSQTVAGLVALIAVLAVGLYVGLPKSSTALPISPSTYSAPLWDKVLGGDQTQTSATWQALNDLKASTLKTSDAQSVSQLAKEAVLAEETGDGRASFPSYFTSLAGPYNCASVTILASSPMKLKVVAPKDAPARKDFAKTLVVWKGDCRPGTSVPNDVNVSYVYTEHRGASWGNIREWDVPGATTLGLNDSNAVTVPAPYELGALSSCSQSSAQALLLVVGAFNQLCTDAAKDGVAIRVQDAYRSPASQAQLFASAVRYYGSQTLARGHVDFSDGNVCASQHCAGTAIDIAPDTKVEAWLQTITACSDGSVPQNGACAPTVTPIKRQALYGFGSPVATNPTYLLFALPLSSATKSSNCAPNNQTAVPTLIAQVFRCRLAAAGITGVQQSTVVAEAEVVSKCESNWQPGAAALNGSFAYTADPVTGQTYTQSGLFMLSDTLAQRYVLGGAPAKLDPVKNANGAASAWLAGQSWGPWPCATGASSAFEAGPVLPQFGGPTLPAWASTY